MKFNTKGFTLIELLVVVSIIGMLTSVVLVSVDSAREKARDTVRISDLEQMNLAVELYASYNSGNYYADAFNHCAFGDANNCWQTSSCYDANDWVDQFKIDLAEYIDLPIDPLQECVGATQRKYVYMSDGIDFKIQFLNPEDPNAFISKADPARDGGPINGFFPGTCSGAGDGSNVTAWAVYTPGAECWH